MVTLMVLAFLANFGFIFLKAFQQLNVVHGNYWLITPISVAMATAEVFVIAKVAEVGFGWIVFPIAIGGALGAMLGMWIHSRMRERELQKQTGES